MYYYDLLLWDFTVIFDTKGLTWDLHRLGQ